MARLIRGDVEALPIYVAGRTPEDVARDAGIDRAVKLASNEVPYGPLPGVTEAVTEALSQSHRYPDLTASLLRERIARMYHLDPRRIITGCGSMGLVEILIKITCMPADEVLYPWRSFEAYPIFTAAAGAHSVQVPNNAQHGHDLDAMLEAITARTRLIFLCSPNNPTSVALGRSELTAFLDAVPDNIPVVIDEAYHEFVTDPRVPEAFVEFRDRPNVVVMRTLSKAWGLAGLRVGWLHGPTEIVEAIEKCMIPFATSMTAQVAAVAALEQGAEMRRRVGMVLAERVRVTEELRSFGLELPDSQANFLWLPLGDQSADFARHCERYGVIVRPLPGFGVRITVGTVEENTAMLAAVREVVRTEMPPLSKAY